MNTSSIDFASFAGQLKRMLRESSLNYINSICASRNHNPNHFWSYFKIVSKSSNTPSKVLSKSGISQSQRICFKNNVSIANCFNEYFASIFTHDNNDDHNLEEHSIANPDIVLENTVLSNLNNNKAHGFDEISARLLTETSSQIAPSLCALFNKSLHFGVFPDDWKLANVVPVHKRNEKSYVQNYRPISLLPLISKVLKRKTPCLPTN